MARKEIVQTPLDDRFPRTFSPRQQHTRRKFLSIGGKELPHE
jgi:hypothetical protein